MSHNILLKHGWTVVFESISFTAYQLNNMLYVKWFNGVEKFFEVYCNESND